MFPAAIIGGVDQLADWRMAVKTRLIASALPPQAHRLSSHSRSDPRDLRAASKNTLPPKPTKRCEKCLVLGRKSGRQLPRSFAECKRAPRSGADHSSAKKRRLTESSIGSS